MNKDIPHKVAARADLHLKNKWSWADMFQLLHHGNENRNNHNRLNCESSDRTREHRSGKHPHAWDDISIACATTIGDCSLEYHSMLEVLASVRARAMR